MTLATESEGRLIVLGGGIAALTAAFYASEPGHETVFPGGIHVFEMTDALGGKGASRRSDGRVRHRIEEHGLHVWFGFYDNAFALLSRCHAYLNREALRGHDRWGTALRDIAAGFRPCSRVAVTDYDGASWTPWIADFPEDATVRPWDERRDPTGFSSPSAMVVQALKLAETFLYSLMGHVAATDPAHSTLLDPALIPVPVRLPGVARVTDALDRIISGSKVPTGGLELVTFALRTITRLATEVRNRLDEPVRRHAGLRRSFYIVDLLLAAVRGLIDDGVLVSGRFEWIDDMDLRAWLVLHGASEESVSGGLLKALVYDLAFAYEDGDPERPSCSAATGVYGLFRLLLTYRGAIMWKMNAGMGEIVFAPIYEALVRRGVRFHFGHEVSSIGLAEAGDRARATHIDFRRRASRFRGRLETLEISEGQLIGRLPHWGPEPPHAANDAGEPVRLELGPHDMVVYGLPVGTIRSVLPQRPPSWEHCAARVKTVATAALQLWLDAPVTRYAPWASPDITVGAFTEPFDTWSDMRTLAGEAAMPDHPAPRSVAYFTNAAPDHHDEPALSGRVAQFVENGLQALWPEFGREMIVDRYSRFNLTPTQRYTLSLPGTVTARLSPRDDSIRNVRPVGDWTRNSISAGCIEAAVISGMIAARVLRPDLPLTIFGESA